MIYVYTYVYIILYMRISSDFIDFKNDDWF